MNKVLEQIYDLKESIEVFQQGIEEKSEQLIEILDKYRVEQGLSWQELATKLGIAKAYLSDIKLGRRKLSKNVLEKISNLI